MDEQTEKELYESLKQEPFQTTYQGNSAGTPAVCKGIKMKDLKQEYRSIKAPEEGLNKITQKMKEAEALKMKKQHIRNLKRTGLTAAAAIAVLIALPNTNAAVAKAMQDLPVVGKVFEVITFRNYEFADTSHEARVEVPEIKDNGSNSQAAGEVNKDVKEYTKQLIAQFEKELAENSQGHQGLDVSHEVVANNNNWFVLKITALETKASGAETVKYYTINKAADSVVKLSDLFLPDADYITLLSNSIKESMRQQMKEDENKAYFIDSKDMPENDFDKIDPNQNFYINSSGQLVITFNEYDIAPGYMGSPEFIITDPAVLKAVNPDAFPKQ